MPLNHDSGRAVTRALRGAVIFFFILTVVPHLAIANDAKSDAKNESSSDPTAAITSAAAFSAATNGDLDEALQLEVFVNGHSTGKIGEFTMHKGKLLALPNELRDLGFRLPGSRLGAFDGLISLSDIPGLTWTIDRKNQDLYVLVGNGHLMPTMLQNSQNQTFAGGREIESGTGATFNYDISNTLASGQVSTNGSLDMRAFSSRGVVSSDWLAYAGGATGSTLTNSAIRLDSSYSFADVNTLRRYSVGDFITSSLPWTRPIRMEGLQVRSDFTMRPDLVTCPLPSIRGTAAVASTVQVLANGNLIASGATGAGPFEAAQLPVMSGAGTITMTVTNALGQQVTVNQPFYASATLLAPGLKTFAGQVGLVRRNWGTASYDYGRIAGSAMYRRGLTPKLTIEGSGEGAPGTMMAGAGAVVLAGNIGIVNVATAASMASGNVGEQISAGAQRIGRVFSVGASATLATRNYRDVASVNGDGVLRKQLSAFSSLYLRHFGSAGVAYAEVNQDAAPDPLPLGIASPERSRVVSANYSFQVRRASIFASEFKSFSNTGGSNGLQIGVSIPIGRRGSANVSAGSDGTVQTQMQRSATKIGEWGYGALVSAGNSTHEFAQVQYKSPFGLFTSGIDSNAGATTLRMESQGAISLVDRAVFPSNTIYDSFAIVDTSPMPHVHVFQENRDVGVTGSSGRLLVPDMRAFDLNHLSIESTDIPADVSLSDPSRQVRPQDRSGVVVKFPIKFSRGALLKLFDEAGVPLPLGSTAVLRSDGASFPVGYDGDAYLEGLGARNVVKVERPDGQLCSVSFAYQSIAGSIPTIGPLRCLTQKP